MKEAHMLSYSIDSLTTLMDIQMHISTTRKLTVSPQALEYLLPVNPSAANVTEQEMQNIDRNDPSALRSFISRTLVTHFQNSSLRLQSYFKDSVQWLLNGGYEINDPDGELTGFEAFVSAPDTCLPLPNDLEDFYLLIWDELFGNESWKIPGFSKANFEFVGREKFREAATSMGTM
jgi:hypothetical protein